MKSLFKIICLAGLSGFALPAFSQLQWNAYDVSGNLVTANVASGGDLASGSTVTFTIPAQTQLSFSTKSFTPFSLAQGGAKRTVTFNVSVSAGFGGVNQRTMGWGLFNSGGTAGLTDDVGYFGLWTGSLIETYDHPSGTANLFGILSSPSNKLGQGNGDAGAPADGLTYTNQIQLVMKADASGISLGTSSSTIAAAGLAMNGLNGATTVAHRSYTNPVNPLLGGQSLFDEFAFMFNNTTGNPVTVTLSAISLGNSLTWDASGANPAAPTDGSGNWGDSAVNWTASANGGSDSSWSTAPGYSAIIGANNGAAGVITITNAAGVTVSNLTFNAAGSGSYNLTGSSIILASNATITVATGVTATNSSQLGGKGFTKAGNGTLVLLPSAAATNSGATTVNAGLLFLAATSISSLNDDLIVNTGAVVQIAASQSIPVANRMFINGGSVTNVATSNPTLSYNIMAFDNGGFLGSAGAQIGQLNVTNFDFRSGTEAFAKFPSTMTANFSVKSTPGTMIVQSRANSSGANGIAGLKLNAGTFICDYANPAPNNDATGGAKYINTAQMTLAGGTLFQRFSATGNRTETVGGVLINPGATTVKLTNNSPTAINYTFAQGVITRNSGGTVDYVSGGSSTGVKVITTTTANSAAGILGGYATYAGTDWAIGTTISNYSAYTTSTDPTTWAAANNISLTGNLLTNVPDLTTINTLKLGGASTLTLNGSLTLAAGGLLVTGTGANSISGGTLLGAGGADLIIHQYSSGDLMLSSILADNGGATSLTKSGPGKLIVTGVNTMTGTNYLNGGTVEVSDLSKFAAGPLVLNNGALRYVGTDATSTRAITLNGVGGTIDIAGNTTLTQTGPVSGGGGFNSPLTPGLNLGDWGGLTKIGSGTLVLAVNNNYNGPTVVSNGVLAINGVNSLTGTSGLTNYAGGGSFTVYGGTLGGTGSISGAVDIKSGGTISPGNGIGTLTLLSGLTLESGSTNFFEVTNNAAGDLLAIQGNLIIQPNSTLAIAIPGTALEPTTNVLITYTGTKSGLFNPTVVVAGGATDGSVTLDESTPGQIKLVVIPQAAITSQPADLTVSTNDPATFSVIATGTAPLAYQWYRYADINGSSPVALTDATNATFVITSAQGSDSGYYGVIVTNNFNSVTSRIATLIVGNIIATLSGPTNQTVIAGNSVTFNTAVVLANPAPTLQWQTNGVDVSGATGLALTLNAVPAADDGLSVSVIATNPAGSTTNFATLTVIVTPVITPQPVNQSVNVGDTATFVSGATGVPVPTLQWYKNSAPLSGQTSGTLTIANAQGANIASYKLVASNAAGSVTSSVVTLSVSSTTLAAGTVAPANGAVGVGYDTPLYVTFNAPVSIVNSGQIRIYNSANPATPVDIIDMSSNNEVISSGIGITNNIQPHSLFAGDTQVINYFPVIISGRTAAIYPHSGVMTSNQTYFVTMDAGVVADNTGAYFSGISNTNTWRFTTKPTGPANPTNLVVAADGSGDFITVQGAVDSIAPGNTNYTLINIHDGNYVEIVDISGKNNLTLRGQSRRGTVVGYANNNNLTGTTAARMAFRVNSSDIKLENLTLTNGTPQGGSQAETLLIYNNGLRCVVDNCDIVSRQDTILINASTSQGYFNNCRIVGNFDYIWGVGVGYFNNCVLHTITNSLSGSYNLTAARTATAAALSTNTPWVNPNGTTFSANGFSFVSCIIEADAGVTNITLAGSNGTPGGLDSWVNCRIDTNAYVNPATALPPSSYVLWQYQNQEITGVNAITYANLQTIGVTNNDPRLLAATNVPVWFYGWMPQLAPNIIRQPMSQTNFIGDTATLTVGVTGIPDAVYQWQLNGTNLDSSINATATNAVLMLSNVQFADAGVYSVVVSNVAGVAASVGATLTILTNTAPALAPVADQSVNVGVSISITNVAMDPDVPPQTLTFNLLNAPAGATIGSSNGIFNWRPSVAAADSTNLITVVVSDSGTPGLSATNNFTIIVHPLTQPAISAAAYAGGQFSVAVNGQVGPDYAVQASTNLTDWVTLFITNSPAAPFNWVDVNTNGFALRFYRVKVGPPLP
ncbi:MAG TPA: pectinesterase family protein [Verrucomicrobiae bacterium]